MSVSTSDQPSSTNASSKRPALESEDEVVARIGEAAEIVPLERLAVSCQCGFASTLRGDPVTPQIQRAKLQLVRRAADTVWG